MEIPIAGAGVGVGLDPVFPPEEQPKRPTLSRRGNAIAECFNEPIAYKAPIYLT
jgi:hypothetical protein